MTDRERAKAAHEKVLSALFFNDNNPTYELCGVTIANMTSPGELFLMEEYKLIKYVGENHNGHSVYQVRFSA